MSTKYNLYNKLVLCIALLAVCSCKKFLAIDPPKTQIVSANVFTNDATATSAINGIYSSMISATSGFASGGIPSITLLSGLSADEFINYSGTADIGSFGTNGLTPLNSYVDNYLWRQGYQLLFYTNSAIEGLSASNGLTSLVKQQLLAEAKFNRAFIHFYLVNLFGDIPVVTTTEYRLNSEAPRVSKADVYRQIVADLKDAEAGLPANYIDKNNSSTLERTRPNKWAATSLLARVYLYTSDWANAESEATTLINNTGQYNLVTNLNNVYLKNSVETIWQLQPVEFGRNTNEGNMFILTTVPNLVSLSNQVMNAFESGDNRKINWVNSFTTGGNTYYFPYKYKVQTGTGVTEYSMVFRLAEQYLIRAEARAQQNNMTGSQYDLNAIRNRAGLPNTAASDQPSLLLAIEHERQVEFFSEWGHRWLDLKRTNRADALLAAVKGAGWQATDVLYPIPQSEINNNKNLTQNPGY